MVPATHAKTGNKPLWRAIHVQNFQKPLVSFSTNAKFQSAKRMCDIFQRITNAVGKVVGRIDLPLQENIISD
tara:strand:- start:72 stop:287 length:216 start_codon:yes stop_codon:yes gene_type:complete